MWAGRGSGQSNRGEHSEDLSAFIPDRAEQAAVVRRLNATVVANLGILSASATQCLVGRRMTPQVSALKFDMATPPHSTTFHHTDILSSGGTLELWVSFHCGSTGRIAERYTYEVGETDISAPPSCGPLFFLTNPPHYNKVRIQSRRSSHAHLTHHSRILQYVSMSQPALCSLPDQSDLNHPPISPLTTV